MFSFFYGFHHMVSGERRDSKNERRVNQAELSLDNHFIYKIQLLLHYFVLNETGRFVVKTIVMMWLQAINTTYPSYHLKLKGLVNSCHLQSSVFGHVLNGPIFTLF